MYRNISYSNYNKEITLWTWDEAGNRVSHKFPFKPFIYLEQKENASATSIFKTSLAKREFDTDYHRKKFVSSSGIKRIFYNLPPEQQFLIERYHSTTDWMSFTKHPLRTYYLDVEIFSPNEFPNAKEANHPINLITIYDTLNDTFYSWGLKKHYHTKQQNVKYTVCYDERDLLKSFLRHWRKDFPDILTSYNGDSFDIPYIVNRLNKLFGDNYANKLSPEENIWSVDKVDRYNVPVTEWNIAGISCIDFMKAYRKFSRNERESYSLDYISNYELGYGKIEHDGMSIAELAEADWNTFVDYNIRDVQLIMDLEKKLHYLDLCRMIGYKGLTKFEKALGTTNVAAGAFALEAKKRNVIIPTFEFKKGHKPPGGLVREPKNGFQTDVISFDAASLYPNTIITLNISPETKIGNFTQDDNHTTIYTVRGKEFKLPNDKFNEWMTQHKVCKSMHKTLFSQNEKGIIPALIEEIYADRKSNKDLGKKLERQLKKLHKDTPEYKEKYKKAEELDVLQYTLKILMNSIYGTFGNSHSVLYDLDIAASITLTGQESNIQAGNAIKKYSKDTHNVDADLLVCGDTDSIFLTITPILKHKNISLITSDGKISDEAMQIILEIGGEDDPSKGYISKYLRRWAKKELLSIDPRFEFKREKIADIALFFDAKKKYITHNLNIEGVPIPAGDKKEWGYTGGEFNSSAISKDIKKLIRNAIQEIIKTQNESVGNKHILDIYSEFCKLTPEILSTRKSVKEFSKYENKANGFIIGKGTPQNSKASIVYNKLLKHLNVENKYEKIKSGDKIKILYVAKNSYGIDYVGFKDKLPMEFGLNPDYDTLYIKTIHPIFERIYDAIGWKCINPTKNYKCDLLSIFE